MKDYPLMKNNITRSDLNKLIEYLKNDTSKIKLTSGSKVFNFEKKWSQWLGVKYSVFVNSGSSANFLTLKFLNKKFPEGGEVIVPPFTWNSDIVSIIDSGFKPVFCDISLNTLGLDENQIEKKITKNTVAVFLTHAQGFNALTYKILKLCKKYNLILIEDACESHGAVFDQKKIGTYGLISNFSFYYAHHLSTIEGGMICTNNKEVYQFLLMLRGHGLLRESTDENFKKKISKKYYDLNPKFIFIEKGYNMRSTELNAIIGLNQLKRLNMNIIKRNKNKKLFLDLLNEKHFYKDFNTNGMSNYAFNLVLKENDQLLMKKIEKNLIKNSIEFRIGSAGGGNQLRQPYIKNSNLKNIRYYDFKNTEHMHNYSMYIGNHPELTKKDISYIVNIINSSI